MGLQKSYSVATAILAGMLVVGGSAGVAWSDTQSAMAGHGWPIHDDTCFASGFAQMQNNCAAAVGVRRLLIIPMQVRQIAPTIRVRASGNGSDGTTACQAISVNVANTSFSATSILTTTTSSTVQTLSFGNLGVQNASGEILGTVHFECSVAEGGGRVINVAAF